METSLNIPRLMISNLGSGDGAEELATGLLYLLKNKGFSVSCCLIGSDFVLANNLQRAADRPVRILEPRLTNYEQMATELYLASLGSDFLLVVSPYSFYDACGIEAFSGSPAELAVRTVTPVLFVSEGARFGSGIVPLIKGFVEFASGVKLAGVVITDQDSAAGLSTASREKSYYQKYLTEQLQIPLVSWFPRKIFSDVDLKPAEQALLPANPTREKMIKFLQVLSQGLDLDLLIQKAGQAESVKIKNVPDSLNCRIKVAVADDPCFALGYANNIESLAYHGARIARFSPLIDNKIPEGAQILYLRSCFLQKYERDLMENQEMLEAIKNFADKNGSIIAEGESVCLLAKNFGDNLKNKGLGILPFSIRNNTRPQKSFEILKTFQDSLLGTEGLDLPMFNPGLWRDADSEKAGKALRGKKDSYKYDGLMRSFNQLFFIGYPYFSANYQILRNILKDSAD